MVEGKRTTPRYRSTRGGDKGLSFEEAVFEGLAKDGGLLVPDFVPDVSEKFKGWAGMKFHEVAYEIVKNFCGEDEMPAADLKDLLKRSYSTFEHAEVVPTVAVNDFYVMELFHGVSFSFKDVALQGLGNFYEYFLKRTRNRRLTIVCATSGDTGGAAIYGLRGKENVDCFVLFPEGRVSPIQQAQMTSVMDKNVHCLAVQGTFDDCQDIVKGLFGNLDLKRQFGFGAVNSINWCRILLQITYYFYTYFKLYPKCDGTMSFSVPTGNFGDILAGYYAKRMGLPVKHLIVATNSNDILHRFFTKGEYDMKACKATISPSMDIGISSNFERYLFYLFGEDGGTLASTMINFRKTTQLHVTEEQRMKACEEFSSCAASEDVCKEIIGSYFKKYGYALCPHSACGVHAVEALREKLQWAKIPNHKMVVLGTAHPAKFHEVVAEVTQSKVAIPAGLDNQGKRQRLQVVPNSQRAVHDCIQRSLYYRGTYLQPGDRIPQSPPTASLPGEPGMWLVALDVEGTLVGEAWLELQKKTGLEELKLTTAHEPDYDKLMKYRLDVLRKHGIKLKDMKNVVKSMEPLPGCKEFLVWLKALVPRVLLLTDTFEEYAMPLFETLGYPTVFCNSLTVDDDDNITGHILRLKDQKRKAVEAFQRLNFRVIAVGDSFNDISMMKVSERAILMNPSEKVVKAHPEFPVCFDYDALKQRIMEIVMDPPAVPPRPVAIPAQLSLSESSRSMWLVLANVAGTFAPEPWPVLAATTGVEELRTTTAQVPDYNELMQYRAKIMRERGIKLQKLYDVMQVVEPLPGASDFLKWLKPIVPRSFMLTDTFEEYAVPIFNKLGHPMVMCNFIEADEEGYMTKHVVRLQDQKRLAVEEFQRLNFRIIAIGFSFNDIGMLKAAEAGILFNPSRHVSEGHPEIPSVKNYEELKAAILEVIKNGESKKRKSPDS